jgi:methyl coenzyme M reductase beta subunit
MILYLTLQGATAQAVSRRHLFAYDLVEFFQGSPCGIFGGQVGTGKGFCTVN